MPSYMCRDGRSYLDTDIIDNIGIGLIDGHVKVYCSVYFGYEEDDDWKGVFPILYINDSDNYIGQTYIYFDKPEYFDYYRRFSLDADLRRKLCQLLTEKQFYGMSGWEYCMKSIEHECRIREIEFKPYAMPNYMKLPVKEEGYRTRTEKMYCEGLGEYSSIESDPIYYLEDGLYIVTVPLREPSSVGHYFKVMRVDMSDEDAYFEERDIISWCRISMERAEYITGYDENMMLTDDEIDRMIAEFERKYPEFVDKNMESHWHRLVDLYDNDFTVLGADASIDPEMLMPDYTKLKSKHG